MNDHIPNITYTLNHKLCTGCGLCEGTCPSKAIRTIVKEGRFLPNVDKSLCNNDKGCHRCYDVCPGLGVDLVRIAKEQFNDNGVETDDLVGRYLECFTGFSTNQNIRYHCASGGMVSQFLIFLLEKKHIDGAVVTAFDPKNELMVRSYIARTKEEVLQGKGSKYAPVSLHGVVQEIKNAEGNRFVIVGLPCHIHGFRKLEAIDKKFRDKVIGYFGIYCSSGRSFYLTEHVLKERGIKKEELQYFAYRDEGCLGSMVAKGIRATSLKPFRVTERFQSYYHPLRSFFIPRRCLLCIDHYAELGDICFGDIHIDPYIADKVGVNSIIVRKQQWLDRLFEARTDGCITLEELSVETLNASQKMAHKKKGRNVDFIALNKKMGRVVPNYDAVQHGKVTPKVFLDYLQNRIQQFLGSHKSLWWLLSPLKKKMSNSERKDKVGYVMAYRDGHNNYGTSLQGYALLKKMQQLGYHVEIIIYDKHLSLIQKTRFVINALLVGEYKNILARLNSKKVKERYPYYEKNIEQRTKAVDGYKKKKLLPFSHNYKGYKKLNKGSTNYDAVVVGSDQVWTPMSLPNKYFNLLFVDDSIPKIAYASSFGVSEIPKFQRKATAAYLNRFQTIGVREHRAKEIVDSLSINTARVVADPTMLLTREEWSMEIKDAKPSETESYIFCYFLGANKEARLAANKLKKKTGYKIIAIRHMDEYVADDETFGDEAPYDVDPNDFVKYISEAAYVCTDSFHCTVFSIIFHKRFMTFYRFAQDSKTGRNSRIDSLFDNLGISEEHLYKGGDIKQKIDVCLDWKLIDKNLEAMRNDGLSFLEDALRNSGNKQDPCKRDKSHKRKREPNRSAIKRFFMELGINWYFLSFLICCILVCSCRNEYLNLISGFRRNIFEPIGIILQENLFANIVLTLLLGSVYLWPKIRTKKFNIYLSFVSIVFIIELLRTSQYEFVFCWKWVLTAFFVLFLIVETFQAIQILKKCKKRSRYGIEKTKSFSLRTDNRELIDIGCENYANILLPLLSSTKLNDEAFAVGVVGSWGSGKTTFLQTLKAKMGNDFLVMEFVPWYSNTPESLVQDFFKCLSSNLVLPNIDIDFSRYLSVLQEYDTSGTAKVLNKLTTNRNTIIKEKEEIQKKLGLIRRKVVVFIDDTDRMGKDELMELLKLIRLTANFRNVIFIVAYDKEYVMHRISESKIERGNEYLKKIFPLEITLPHIERDVLPRLFEQELSRYGFKTRFINAIKDQLEIKYGHGNRLISKYVKTFRDVKNFVNSLIVSYELIESSPIKNEYSYKDFFWMEVIHTYLPGLYDILKNDCQLLLDVDSEDTNRGQILVYRTLSDKKDDEKKKKTSVAEKEKEERKKALDKNAEQILLILFREENNDDASIKGLNNYYKYFIYRIPTNIISNAEFSGFLKWTNGNEIPGKISNYRKENKIASFFIHLSNFKPIECSDPLQVKNYVTVIIEMADYYTSVGSVRILFKKGLDTNNSKLIDAAYVYEAIKQKLKNIRRNSFLAWNSLLASIYFCTIYDSMTGEKVARSYRSVLSNKQIEELMKMNCDCYLDELELLPNICEIAKDGSDINKFVKTACVPCSCDESGDNIELTNLIFDNIVKHYSAQKEENDRDTFLSYFEVNEEDPYWPEEEQRIEKKKNELFGSVEKFDEFVDKCFVKPDEKAKNGKA